MPPAIGDAPGVDVEVGWASGDGQHVGHDHRLGGVEHRELAREKHLAAHAPKVSVEVGRGAGSWP